MGIYKIGDIVKLRDDLEAGERYNELKFNANMENLKNKPVKIVGIDLDGDYETESWYINDEMIEGLWEECKPKLKLIDVLNMIARGELKEGTKVKIRDYVYVLRRQYCSDVMPDLLREDEDGDEVVSLFEDYYLSGILQDEVELIEPPCEHECVADIGKSIEPTDNTKIEELDIKGLCEIFEGKHTVNPNLAFSTALNKLNEVIRYINKE